MRKILKHGCFAAFFMFVFWTGYRGIDFGGHWDEPHMQRTVRTAILNHRLLPGWYNYPSVTWGLVLSSLLPDIVDQWNNDARTKQSIATLFDSSGTLRVRTVFLAVTLLSLVWVYMAVLAWRERWPEALLAAAILGSSWEMAYHARWIAPDGVLMQFGALFLLLVVLALRGGKRRPSWLTAAAVAAGLACGSKYPGGILLLPLLFSAYRAGGLRLAVRVTLVFAGVFLMTTPGAVFEFGAFLHDVGYEIRHYAGGHPGYSVGPGPQHIGLMTEYLALVAFSRYPSIALATMVFAIVGAVRVWRRDRGLHGVMLWLPLIYFLYVGMQRVMFVRNLLILMPILAMLSARGIMWTIARLPGIAPRSAAATVVGVVLIVNLVWLVSASSTIIHRHSPPEVGNLVAYINAHQGDRIFVSSNVAHSIGAEPLHEFPADVTQDRNEATAFLVDTCDAYDLKWWPGNHRGRWHVVSGPYEVNFDYYPTWGVNCRVVAFDAAVGELLGAIRGEVGTRANPHVPQAPIKP